MRCTSLHMPAVSVRIASDLTGKDRSTITRAIESGRLSATRDETGRFLIDPAELERAFGPLRDPDATDDAEHEAAQASHESALARELELVREMLERERSERQRELRQWEEERAFLRTLVDRQTDQVKLLADLRPKEPPRNLWQRLTGRA
jgi:hypothetical protein